MSSSGVSQLSHDLRNLVQTSNNVFALFISSMNYFIIVSGASDHKYDSSHWITHLREVSTDSYSSITVANGEKVHV